MRNLIWITALMFVGCIAGEHKVQDAGNLEVVEAIKLTYEEEYSWVNYRYLIKEEDVLGDYIKTSHHFYLYSSDKFNVGDKLQIIRKDP